MCEIGTRQGSPATPTQRHRCPFFHRLSHYVPSMRINDSKDTPLHMNLHERQEDRDFLYPQLYFAIYKMIHCLSLFRVFCFTSKVFATCISFCNQWFWNGFIPVMYAPYHSTGLLYIHYPYIDFFFAGNYWHFLIFFSHRSPSWLWFHLTWQPLA